jgi:hypothetical protein
MLATLSLVLVQVTDQKQRTTFIACAILYERRRGAGIDKLYTAGVMFQLAAPIKQ